jgi:hypothetical protein
LDIVGGVFVDEEFVEIPSETIDMPIYIVNDNWKKKM